jgi:hypothetical protein
VPRTSPTDVGGGAAQTCRQRQAGSCIVDELTVGVPRIYRIRRTRGIGPAEQVHTRNEIRLKQEIRVDILPDFPTIVAEHAWTGSDCHRLQGLTAVDDAQPVGEGSVEIDTWFIGQDRRVDALGTEIEGLQEKL